MAIICSDEKLEVGQVVVNGDITNGEREWVKASWKVIGETTEAEYLAFCAEMGFVGELEPKDYYYRVQMD